MNKQIYLNNLIEQYISATGTKNIDMNSMEFLTDFRNWIIKNNSIAQNILTILNEKGIEYDTPSLAEIGKGYLDTIVAPYEATIITPYTYGLDKRTGNGETIESELRIAGGIPILPSKEILKPNTIIDPRKIKTFMMHNPYDELNVNNLANLHNNSEYKGIIFSVFGKKEDKDRTQKEKTFLDLRAKLYDGYSDESISYGDTYCHVITTDQTKKILSRSKNQ